MKKIIVSLSLASALLLSACNGRQDMDSRVVAEVGEMTITEAEFFNGLKELHGEEVLAKLVEEKVIDYHAAKLGMSEEEINNKIDEQIAEIREELEQQMGIETEEDFYSFLAHNGISDSEVFRKMLKQQIVVQEYAIKDIEVSEEEVEAEYNSLFGNVQEVQASHILVDDLETAELIKEKLDAGADFAELAIEYSKDPGSGQKGGELGFFPRGQMVPAFEEVAFSLSVGEISDPVESQFGYHIIFVTDQVVYDKTFEEAEEEIRTNLQLNQAEQFHVVLNEMKEEVKIKIKDQQFKDLFEN